MILQGNWYLPTVHKGNIPCILQFFPVGAQPANGVMARVQDSHQQGSTPVCREHPRPQTCFFLWLLLKHLNMMQVLPTPESPIRSSLKRWSNLLSEDFAILADPTIKRSEIVFLFKQRISDSQTGLIYCC